MRIGRYRQLILAAAFALLSVSLPAQAQLQALKELSGSSKSADGSSQQTQSTQENAPSSQDQAVFKQLADVLENPNQRQELIKALRNISQSSTDTKADDATATDNSTAADPNTTAEGAAIAVVTENTKAAINQVAELPKVLADEGKRIAIAVGSELRYSFRIVSRIVRGEEIRWDSPVWGELFEVLKKLLIWIVFSTVLFHGLNYLRRPLKKRVNVWVFYGKSSKPLPRKLVAITVVAIADVVLLAIVYLIVLNVMTSFSSAKELSSSAPGVMFLNAFVMIELIKTGVRGLFYPRYPGLRLLTEPNDVARYWYRWVVFIVSLVGYGYLVVVPLVSATLSYAMGQVVSTVIAFAAFIYGMWGVLAKRVGVRDTFRRWADNANLVVTKGFLRFMAVTWHWFALLYFLMLLVVTLLRAENALPFVLQGTLKTILAVTLGLILSNLLSVLLTRKIRLPENWAHAAPALERQLNTYLPPLILVLRSLIHIVAYLSILSAWNLVNFKLGSFSGSIGRFMDQWIGAFIIVLVTGVVWLILSNVIENRLSKDTGDGLPSARTQTLLTLIKNALAIMLIVIGLMMVMSQIGINIGPLIAGAGVFGLAVGFGAQTLVKDVITGIFIQVENAMNTGDFVTVDGISGTAEKISIRSVGLRDTEGTYHLIPFSSVTTVSNYMRGFAYHKGEYGIGYNEDIDEAFDQLQAAFEELARSNWKDSILEPMTIAGVTELADSAVVIRVLIKTKPGDQWAIGRAYNRLVKIYFDRAGIEIPYPHQTLYFGQQKDGSAPPANVRMMAEDFSLEGLPESEVSKQGKSSPWRSHHRNTDGGPENSPERQLQQDSMEQAAEDAKAEEEKQEPSEEENTTPKVPPK